MYQLPLSLSLSISMSVWLCGSILYICVWWMSYNETLDALCTHIDPENILREVYVYVPYSWIPMNIQHRPTTHKHNDKTCSTKMYATCTCMPLYVVMLFTITIHVDFMQLPLDCCFLMHVSVDIIPTYLGLLSQMVWRHCIHIFSRSRVHFNRSVPFWQPDKPD